MLLNNQWSTKEINEGVKKYLETNENENKMTQHLQDTVKVVLRGKFIAVQALSSRNKNISNKQPNLTPKPIIERRTKKPRSQQKERNHKDQIRNKQKRNEGNNSKDQ